MYLSPGFIWITYIVCYLFWKLSLRHLKFLCNSNLIYNFIHRLHFSFVQKNNFQKKVLLLFVVPTKNYCSSIYELLCKRIF